MHFLVTPTLLGLSRLETLPEHISHKSRILPLAVGDSGRHLQDLFSTFCTLLFILLKFDFFEERDLPIEQLLDLRTSLLTLFALFLGQGLASFTQIMHCLRSTFVRQRASHFF